jgi:cell division protein FtsB
VDRIEEYERVRERVREVGEERAEETHDIYETVDDKLESYRDEATGHGDFEKYIELRGFVANTEEDLEEVYMGDAFESALSHLEARTLRDKHFRRARADLEDVKNFAETYERYEQLKDELKDELRSLEKRKKELRNEVQETEERLKKARSAEDIDASPLREAVETYNESVREDFEAFVNEAPAVEVARLGEKTLDAPLVDDAPVEDGVAERLSRYVDDETVGRVLELAGASDGKLSHYIEDTDGFRDAVPRTFFETASPKPFELSYEPEGVVRKRVPELVRLVSSFADEETVAVLRRIGATAERGEYGRMRRAIVAGEEAGAGTEEIEERLEELRAENEDVEDRISRLRSALSDAFED